MYTHYFKIWVLQSIVTTIFVGGKSHIQCHIIKFSCWVLLLNGEISCIVISHKHVRGVYYTFEPNRNRLGELLKPSILHIKVFLGIDWHSDCVFWEFSHEIFKCREQGGFVLHRNDFWIVSEYFQTNVEVWW